MASISNQASIWRLALYPCAAEAAKRSEIHGVGRNARVQALDEIIEARNMVYACVALTIIFGVLAVNFNSPLLNVGFAFSVGFSCPWIKELYDVTVFFRKKILLENLNATEMQRQVAYRNRQ